MGKIALSILFLSLLAGCVRNNSEVFFQKDNKATIVPSDADITEVTEVQWKVGVPRKNEIVSKGIRIKFQFPKFKNSEFEQLIAEHAVTGWMVRLFRETPSSSIYLGAVYSPLVHSFSDNREERRQVEFVIMDVFYSAAYISRAYENLSCPVLGHQKRVTNFELNDRGTTAKSIVLHATEQELISGKIAEASLNPYNVNGGKDLAGSYFADLSLYNQKKGMRVSSYYRFPSVVTVLGEQERPITGCKNQEDVILKGAPSESGRDKIKNFRIK